MRQRVQRLGIAERLRERDFGKERKSKTGEELGNLTPPSDLPGGIDDPLRDLREDLLKALDRRYPPKYEDLIKRYFRSLSREENPTPTPTPDLPEACARLLRPDTSR